MVPLFTRAGLTAEAAFADLRLIFKAQVTSASRSAAISSGVWQQKGIINVLGLYQDCRR
jgi:hypothetical protein